MVKTQDNRALEFTPSEYAAARERGRSKAAQVMISDPVRRKEMEDRFGLAKCMLQYPEAYGSNAESAIIVLP